ncbi:hypothetical protein B0T24DRAFT_681431 [Lasiosphaeria ovina]|uniref:Uncharacterized protein n=1 Tax=Lasiosphaeria ovina TaxID=92902 RepID=A0AAE0K3H0_9PEZI|nr:hypothetical protein B0T24DRAFT_681431 [Lasiosphaeria ovina]
MNAARYTSDTPSDARSRHSTASQPKDQAAECAKNSHDTQRVAVLLLLPLSLLFLAACLGAIVALAVHGPVLVPQQDTRITSTIISASSKLATLIMGLVFARSAWASGVGDVVRGRRMTARKLVAACRPFLSLEQLQSFGALPAPFRLHVAAGGLCLAAMVATSPSFRYDALPTAGTRVALVPDVAFACPADKVAQTGLFICDQGGSRLNILTNTSLHAWDYIGEVNAGGQHTVAKQGDVGDESLGANVTLATLPAGWKLGPTGNDLPWMAMSVSCRARAISVAFAGSGYRSNTSVFLDGDLAAVFDIGAMPQWNAAVHLLLRVNESDSAFSSLGEYDVIMLGRDEDQPGGSSMMPGLDMASVTPLGSAVLDLYGYGAIKQPLAGAAARCTFWADAGGDWPPGPLWPPLNHTTNTVWGALVDDRPTPATAMLNYGASWQYTIVSDNDVPGGSVAYIANNTGPGVAFHHLLAAYIRNQWALTAYAVSRHTYYKLERPFAGTGPEQLFVSATLVAALPAAALAVAIAVAARACVAAWGLGYWVNRVEFGGWWLLKAARPDLYGAGFGNATEDAFMRSCEKVDVQYVDVKPRDGVGQLLLRRAGEGLEPFQRGRVYQ